MEKLHGERAKGMMVCYFWMDFVWYLLEYKKNSVGCERHGKKKHTVLWFFARKKGLY